MRRVLAFAQRPARSDQETLGHRDLAEEMTFVGLQGMIDPPREEAIRAVAACRDAGIRVKMITGDHAVTAAAIAGQIGLDQRAGPGAAPAALTGTQLATLSDSELTAAANDTAVFARVTPEQKLRLVQALQARGEVVAMTGDGVNDAPALRRADIGVAMGITGTEVSKDAAVMILTDDNFATIVKAVEFGRAIYDNLSKYIRFQMAMLSAFILSYLGASIFGILGGVPFSPLVVLFVNFLIQVPIAIALGFDKPLPGLMERKPRPLSQPVLSRSQWIRLIFTGLLIAVGTLLIERQYEAVDLALAATMGFVVFSLFNVALGLSARSETGTIFVRDTVGDRRQVQLYGLALLLTLLATELGFIQRILGTVSLSLDQWLLCIGLAFVLILIDEAIKFFMRRRRGGDSTQTAPQTAGQSVA